MLGRQGSFGWEVWRGWEGRCREGVVIDYRLFTIDYFDWVPDPSVCELTGAHPEGRQGAK